MYTMLHLGLGSFHRAHQAVYQQRLHDAGDERWALAGGNIRADMADTIAALRASGGAYTLETVSPTLVRSYQRITAIREVIAHDAELSGLIARGADPATRIVSFTVTEAGYYLDAANRLDLNFADLAADLEAARDGHLQPQAPTIYGALTAILRARRAAGAGPLTLLNCDNLRHNGDRSAPACCSSSRSPATANCWPGCRPTPAAPTRWSTASHRGPRPRCAHGCWRPPASTTLRR